jgi:hypothetical protein
MAHAKTTVASAHGKPLYQSLYVQVLTAIAIGIALGHFYPQVGAQMKPLGDAFIKLIKMIIAPIIFCTVVHGIASMQDMKKVGRVGLKALIYRSADDDRPGGRPHLGEIVSSTSGPPAGTTTMLSPAVCAETDAKPVSEASACRESATF